MDLCHTEPLPGRPCCSVWKEWTADSFQQLQRLTQPQSHLLPGHALLSIWEQKGAQWEQSEEEMKQ